MVLGVGHVERAVGVGESLRTRQGRLARRPAVARVALFAGARDVVDGLVVEVDAVDGVPLAQREIEVAVGVEGHRARAVQRDAGQRRAVRGRFAFAGPGERFDEARPQVDAPHPVVADVADEQAPVRGEHDAVGRAQPRRRGRPAVAGETGLAGARHRRDDAGPHVHLADRVVVALDDVEVAARVELDLVRHVQQGLGRRPAVAAVAPPAVAGDGRRGARRQTQAADHLVVEVAEVERAVRTDHDPVRVVDPRVRQPRRAVADDRRHIAEDLEGLLQRHRGAAVRVAHLGPHEVAAERVGVGEVDPRVAHRQADGARRRRRLGAPQLQAGRAEQRRAVRPEHLQVEGRVAHAEAVLGAADEEEERGQRLPAPADPRRADRDAGRALHPGLEELLGPVRQHQHGAEAVAQLAPRLVGQGLAPAVPLARGRSRREEAERGGEDEGRKRSRLSAHRPA